MFEDEETRKPKGQVLGADLSPMSIEALKDYVTDLEAEIVRVRSEIARKQAALGGAEALFGRGRT